MWVRPRYTQTGRVELRACDPCRGGELAPPMWEVDRKPALKRISCALLLRGSNLMISMRSAVLVRPRILGQSTRSVGENCLLMIPGRGRSPCSGKTPVLLRNYAEQQRAGAELLATPSWDKT